MLRSLFMIIFLFQSSFLSGMGSKLRALGSKLPVVSALAAAQLYKEYEDSNAAILKSPIEYGVRNGATVGIPSVLRKPLYSKFSTIPTDYIEERVAERLNGKISPDLNVHVLRSDLEEVSLQLEDPSFLSSLRSTTIIPPQRDAYATPSIVGNNTFVGIPTTEDSKFIIEHEISHIERAFFAKFNGWYRKNGQKLHIPLAVDACLVLAGLRKTIGLGALALAHSFHEQMSNLINRYVEQDADDHVPDTKEFLEDGIRAYSEENKRLFASYQLTLICSRSKEDTFLSLCELLDQFPLCEDKLWGYTLWEIIKFDPKHPSLRSRIEKLQQRLDKLNEIKEEEAENFWMGD